MRREIDATTVVEPYIALAEKAGCRIIVGAGFHGIEVATGELSAATIPFKVIDLTG